MNLRTLKKAIGRPKEPIMEINKRINYYNSGTDYYREGVDFITEDWDLMTILDSCRYDTFAKISDLPGDLSSRKSRGAGTREFLRGNFRDRTLYDTVYVTANPQFDRRRESLNTEFHHVESVWKYGWDDDLQTVPPEAVTKVALRVANEFPHKRLIVHYMQPHGPFIAESARGKVIGPGKTPPNERSLIEHWKIFLAEELTSKEVWWEAYEDTLKLALPEVNRLLSNIEGKHVVTSDHGEMLGSRARPIPVKYWDHRIGIHVDELLKVPWLEYTNSSRRSITSEPPVEADDLQTEDVSERLGALGYMET